MNETVPQFRGKLDDFLTDFTFSSNYQISTASFSVNRNPEDPLRSLRFVLNREIRTNQLVLRTPKYDYSTQEGFDFLFALGSKSIGRITDTYQVQFTRFDKTYYLCNEDAGLTLEVLKVEETEDDLGVILYVWYKLGNIALNLCDSNDDEVLSDAYILAQYPSFRFGEGL
ncbi:MAG: hypothetical protein ACJAZK_000942 [Psychroserpens sp.]|uniref:hypothetical protein n=1 Tax=Psychroserpens sp. TaxID=2020870 RepID=UPI0039E30798